MSVRRQTMNAGALAPAVPSRVTMPKRTMTPLARKAQSRTPSAAVQRQATNSRMQAVGNAAARQAAILAQHRGRPAQSGPGVAGALPPAKAIGPLPTPAKRSPGRFGQP